MAYETFSSKAFDHQNKLLLCNLLALRTVLSLNYCHRSLYRYPPWNQKPIVIPNYRYNEVTILSWVI